MRIDRTVVSSEYRIEFPKAGRNSGLSASM